MRGLRLYDYAASGNCYKVRLLLAQLEQPYERVPVDIFAGETLGDDWTSVNPLREVPVLETADGPCCRTGAILSIAPIIELSPAAQRGDEALPW